MKPGDMILPDMLCISHSKEEGIMVLWRGQLLSLYGAMLARADLHGAADLCDAYLCVADLSEAKLRGEDLRGAKLWRTLMPDGKVHK